VIVPAYGPNWRFKVARMSAFMWHIFAAHGQFRRSQIHVAPWNRRRRPKRATLRRQGSGA